MDRPRGCHRRVRHSYRPKRRFALIPEIDSDRCDRTMTAAGRAGTVAVMRFAHGSAAARWRSSAVEDVCLTAALLVAAELEIVLDGLGADSAALAARRGGQW